MGLSLGLIGYPVQHSLSPWIHQQFMQKLGMEGSYELYETASDQLASTINQLKQKNVNGFNITVPYKQAIMPFLDEIDPDAEKIGAVNTVVNDNGKWKGYNTDGMGYVKSVKESFPEVFHPDTRVLVLGAGGAARGIYRALVQSRFNTIDIANRTLEKAEDLLDLKDETVNTTILSFQEAEERLHDYQFIVQTTSVGMSPNNDEQVISLQNLSSGAVVSDIVYNPLMTSILTNAKNQKGKVHQGHAMLLYQAHLAFEIWTGKQVPIENMLTQLEERLRGNA